MSSWAVEKMVEVAGRLAEQLAQQSGELRVMAEELKADVDELDPSGAMPYAEPFTLPMANLDKAWYEAAHYFEPYNHHPERCEDWNLESGGNTDYGEPLVAPFAGVVINARDYGGQWGKIIRILGRTRQGELVVWMGAHLAELSVAAGTVVRAGDLIGTIGTANGLYYAHLHEQISVGEVPAPWTFGGDRRFDFRQPDQFYIEHGVNEEVVRHAVEHDAK